jgi:hypothetical protein
VDVDIDACIAGGVGTREAHSGGRRAATTSDGELVAGHVELSTTRGGSAVQSNCLSTEEVVARGDVGGDLDINTATALVHVLGAPIVGVTTVAARGLGPRVLVDLEESTGTVGGAGVVNLGQVSQDGAVVSTTDGLLGARAGVMLGMCVSKRDDWSQSEWSKRSGL